MAESLVKTSKRKRKRRQARVRNFMQCSANFTWLDKYQSEWILFSDEPLGWIQSIPLSLSFPHALSSMRMLCEKDTIYIYTEENLLQKNLQVQKLDIYFKERTKKGRKQIT